MTPPAHTLARRSLLAAAVWLPLAVPAQTAAALADVLVRPALQMRPASRPAMLRVTRADRRLVAVGERGVVLLSDDEGVQWRQAPVPVSVTLTGVRFIDGLLGWAIGHAAVVLRTQDGGQSWTLQHDGSRIEDGLGRPLLDLHFDDPLNGWAVGAYGLLLRTRDGGTSWQDKSAHLPNPKKLHLNALVRQGDSLFIAGEQGLFISLPDEGPPATPGTPYRGSFFALAPLPDRALLLGGLRGTLLLRDAAGEFRSLDSGTRQGIVSISPLPQQRLALVDQSGRVLVGQATSGLFQPLQGGTVQRWVAVAATEAGGLVAAGSAGMGSVAATALAATAFAASPT